MKANEVCAWQSRLGGSALTAKVRMPPDRGVWAQEGDAAIRHALRTAGAACLNVTGVSFESPAR
jgi:hypothetical protein